MLKSPSTPLKESVDWCLLARRRTTPTPCRLQPRRDRIGDGVLSQNLWRPSEASEHVAAAMDDKPLCILTKVEEELGLELSAPAVLPHSRLDEWFQHTGHRKNVAPRLLSKGLLDNTAHIAEKAFISARQAASALHTMAVPQMFQAKLLKSLDENGQNTETFKEL